MHGYRILLLAATLAATAVAGAAAASTYVVDAQTPIASWLDTGLDLSPGQTYDFTVINPATIWSAGAETPFSRDSTAASRTPGATLTAWLGWVTQ